MKNEEKLVQYLEQENPGGFFVSDLCNVRYISGYTGDDSFLFITKAKKYFITDPRYTEQAPVECPEYEIYNWRTSGAGTRSQRRADACARRD